jgi:hypothetical protein
MWASCSTFRYTLMACAEVTSWGLCVVSKTLDEQGQFIVSNQPILTISLSNHLELQEA